MSSLRDWFTTKDKEKVEINIESKILSLAFLPGETPRILSGGENGARLHRPKDHPSVEPVGLNTRVLAVAASKDGEWIVAGTTDGFMIRNSVRGGRDPVIVQYDRGARAIDISSDSKWVVTGSDARTVDVWDLSTGQRRPGLGPLKHEYNVVAVKFCPCGERIATATLFGSIRIYATSSGQRLLTVPVSVRSTHDIPNITLAWFTSHDRPQIFAASHGQIECLDCNKGSLVFQWPVRGATFPPSIALSPNNKIVAYSTNDTVILRDTTTRRQLGDSLKHSGNIACITFSPSSDVLVVGVDTTFTIWDLRKLLTNAPYFDPPIEYIEPCVHHKQDTTAPKLSPATFSLPLMCIGNKAVRPWFHGFLKEAEEALSAEIITSPRSSNYNAFANRALVRVRMGKEGITMALEDVKESLDIQKSPIGQIAKAIAIIHQEKQENQTKHELAWHETSNLLKDYDLGQHKFLLEIIQSILFCLLGKYDEESSQISKLSTDQKDQKLLLLVQANIHLIMNNFELAVKSFKKAGVPTIFSHDETPEMQTLSFIFGWRFSGLEIQIQQKNCECLLDDGNPEAAGLFLKVKTNYEREFVRHAGLSKWAMAFRGECLKKLEACGDQSLSSKDYDKAIRQYMAMEHLTDDPKLKHILLLKQSQAHAETENWEKAVQDANKAIELDGSSPWGYEKKFTALYACANYDGAAEALGKVISLFKNAQDAKSIDLRNQGAQPDETKKIATEAIQKVLARPRPHMLINTKSGRLCNKQKQIEAFMAHPKYKDLVLSRTSEVEVEEVIRQYFRYAIFSHTWEDNGEPEFHNVENKSVVNLVESFPNTKLKTFCEKTREHGYWWAWSDTCCINKAQKDVLDMSLRSMYRWYSESSLTIVHLRGVLHQLGVDVDLHILDELLQKFVDCRWNKRAWTLQEYFASNIIHFYTEDWKPYLPVSHMDPGSPINHKNHSAIHRGMELVTGLNKDHLAVLQPGSSDARIKLRLASTREATRNEDIAYALLGIFKITIPAIYGDDEAPRALGRLLEALLTQSADVAILAWTGTPSEYNTCLPSDITVYQEPESRHVPSPIGEATLASPDLGMSSTLSPTDLDSAVKLHDSLNSLPPPKLHHGRLELPGILFRVSLTPSSSKSYAATASLLEDIVLEATEDLSNSRDPVLVHPWFSYLLEPSYLYSDYARRKTASRLFAALRQPFGALLLSLDNTYRSYQRIATDQLITAQIREGVSPEQLLENISVLYIR